MMSKDILQLFIKPVSKSNTTLLTTKDTSIKEVKSLISSKIGIPNNLFNLRLSDKILVDNEKTLRDYHIEDNSNLYLSHELKGGENKLLIKDLQGIEYDITYDSNDTISAVKTKIKEVNGLTEQCLRLIHAGRGLEDMRTLGDYAIQGDATLHLVYRLRDGNIG